MPGTVLNAGTARGSAISCFLSVCREDSDGPESGGREAGGRMKTMRAIPARELGGASECCEQDQTRGDSHLLC